MPFEKPCDKARKQSPENGTQKTENRSPQQRTKNQDNVTPSSSCHRPRIAWGRGWIRRKDSKSGATGKTKIPKYKTMKTKQPDTNLRYPRVTK